MDINLLLKAGMRDCGRVLKVLPTEGDEGIGSPTNYMMKVLREETLPSLDILHPMIMKKSISTNNLIPLELNNTHDILKDMPNTPILDDRYSKYRIPLDVTDGHEILTIKSCVPISGQYGNMGNRYSSAGAYNELPWGNHWGRSCSGDLYGAAMASAVNYADRQLLGSVSRNFRFYFYSPNILMITNYVGPLSIAFCLKNDENLMGMDDMTFDSVRRLFVLDLKKSIFNEYGNYTEIDTPMGSVDLKISAWESAEQERNELFDTYRSTSHFRTSSMRS